MNKLSLIVILALSANFAHAAGTASWANWASASKGTFTQNSNLINVTYSGDQQGVYSDAAPFTKVPSSFEGGGVTNLPSNSLKMTGGYATINTITFSQAVINPLIAIWSLGQGGLPASFNFQGISSADIVILSQGAGNWGGGSLTQSGSVITGREGNGLVELLGTYTSISFTTPVYENYYGATVGALSNVSVPVPEADSYALILTGLGLVGLLVGRKQR